MALIKCGECNKKVSDKAATCPNCGNPIKDKPDEVSIRFVKMPLAYKVNIYNDGNIIAQGKFGDVITFDCSESMDITIKSKRGDNFNTTVNPGCKYQVGVRGLRNDTYIERVDMFSGIQPW